MLSEFIAVDVETTGVLPENNEVIEIGAVRVKDGQIVDRFDQLVQPKGEVPIYVSRLTGIKPKELEKAPSFASVCDEFLDFMGDHYFVAHNADFDFGIINKELTRLNRPTLTNRVLDSQDIAILLHPELNSHKLVALAQAYGISLTNRHRAFSDAECLAYVLIEMLANLKTLHPIIMRESLRILGDSHQIVRQLIEANYNPSVLTASLDYKKQLAIVNRQNSGSISHTQHPEMNASAVDLLGDNQRIKKALPGYEKRQSQIDMAQLITQALESEQHGIIEAGTGCGKTMAYLLPTLLWGGEHKEPVLVSTKTKQLQDQILDKEIPRLEKILQRPIKATVIKGKENYVDLRRFDVLYLYYIKEGRQSDGLLFLGLLAWILKTKTGELSDCHPNIVQRFASKIRFTPDNPTMSQRDEVCFVQYIRRRAKQSDVVITNHALVFSDLVNQAGILPKAPVVVLDEAHTVEDVATQSFSTRFDHAAFQKLKTAVWDKKKEGLMAAIELQLNHFDTDQQDQLNQFIQEMKDQVEEIHFKHKELIKNIKTCLKEQVGPDVSRVECSIDDNLILSSSWRDVETAKEALLAAYEELMGQFDACQAIFETRFRSALIALWQVFDGVKDLVMSMQSSISTVFYQHSGAVCWIEADKKLSTQSIRVQSAPIHCKAALSSHLFQSRHSVFCVSATLKENAKFDFFVDRVGLADSGRLYMSLDIPSDFDYQKQSQCYLYPGSGPVEEKLVSVFENFKGKALVLMTSHEALRSAYERLKTHLEDTTVTLLCQGETKMPSHVLVSRLQSGKDTILMGVDTFWEGVDVRGLNMVIIGKLPFPAPNAIHQARMKSIKESGGNPFKDYQLPLAILKFRQGIGRLIRSKRDRGTLVILDERMNHKMYGHFFRKEIEKYPLKTGALHTV